MKKSLVVVSLAAAFLTPVLRAQTFFARYEARTTRYQADQPKWIPPMVSPYPMLAQLFRTDFTRQITPALAHNWNLGAGRGLSLIPMPRTEVDIFLPGFVEHGDKTLDGFGDISFSGKYRILSANEKKGNYLLSGIATVSVPTGSYKNGATDATVTPALTGGKGWGKFDAFTYLGGNLPAGNVRGLGRTVVSNTVLQYHVQKFLYPEFEINSTSFYGGTRDGKIQTFVTPGLVTRFPLHPRNPKSRIAVVAGGAFQIATTGYHGYNHAGVFSGRLIF